MALKGFGLRLELPCLQISKSMKLASVLEEEAKNVLLSQELKTKTSTMSIGFNVPENPKTTIRASVHLGGTAATSINNELRSASGDVDEKTLFLEMSYGV